MPQFTLARTGDVPVTFTGDWVFQGDTSRKEGPGEKRYHHAGLYRTGKGRYVLEVVYHSKWPNEDDRSDVIVCDSVKSLRNAIREFNPIPPNIGYPDGANYAYKQARLHQDLQSRFDNLIREMMMGVAGEVAERID